MGFSDALNIAEKALYWKGTTYSIKEVRHREIQVMETGIANFLNLPNLKIGDIVYLQSIPIQYKVTEVINVREDKYDNKRTITKVKIEYHKSV